MLVGLGMRGTDLSLRSFEVVDLRSQPRPTCSPPPALPIDMFRAVALVDASGRLGVCGGRQSLSTYNNQCYFLQNGVWQASHNMLEKRYFAGISTVTLSSGNAFPFVTGGQVSKDSPFISANSTELLTCSGWMFKAELPVQVYSHAQVSIGSQVWLSLLFFLQQSVMNT